MAYFNQAMKAKMAPKIKAWLRVYGMKGSLSVSHHSTVVLTLKSGKLDLYANLVETLRAKGNEAPLAFTPDHFDINPYWYKEHFTGRCKDFVCGLFTILNEGNHDRSDIQSDYFDVGWYVYVHVGRWNQPYIHEKSGGMTFRKAA